MLKKNTVTLGSGQQLSVVLRCCRASRALSRNLAAFTRQGTPEVSGLKPGSKLIRHFIGEL